MTVYQLIQALAPYEPETEVRIQLCYVRRDSQLIPIFKAEPMAKCVTLCAAANKAVRSVMSRAQFNALLSQ